MLTSDLLRVRTRKGVIIPRYIDAEDEALRRLAVRFVHAFEANVGRSRSYLDEAIADIVGDTPDLILRKGLVKLLEDRCEFEVQSPIPPAEVREVVFNLAARVHPVTLDSGAEQDLLLWSDGGLDDQEMVPDVLNRQAVEGQGDEVGDTDGEVPHGPPRAPLTHRDAVLRRAGAVLGIPPEAVLGALYADLAPAHILKTFKPIDGPTLLQRYNLACAQAVLFKATKLDIAIKGNSAARYRQLFRALKFHRLMHRIEVKGKGHYHIEVDGPVSLFKSVNRYGLQMAVFLPALIKCTGWKLEAELLWGKRREHRLFKLNPKAGLVSHYKDRGVYETQEERWFVERFEALDTPWQLDRKPALLEAEGQDLIVPDAALCHPDGRVAYLEIIGFWRKGSLLSRVEQLRRGGMTHLILAVSKNMQGSVEGLGDVPAEVIYFRDIIPPREVVRRAEVVGKEL